MRFPQSYAQQAATTNVPITGTSGSTIAGPQIDSGLASITIGAYVSATLGTTSLTVTGKWQVLVGATWVDVVESNNPANVTIGTAPVTVAKVYSAPLAVTAGNRPARFVLVTGGATGVGGATDFMLIGYDFRAPVNVYGS